MTAVTVIGNGAAAHRLVRRLHHHGHPGPLTVLGAEQGAAYHRALLTSVLDGTLPTAHLAMPPHPAGVRVHTGTRATHVDLRHRRVRTDTGDAHDYDVLVLATGARPVRPRLAGGPLTPAVRTVRTLTDAARPLGAGPVVVAGGGLRGVETAYALGRAGHDVTLVHPGPVPLHRLLDGRAGALLAGALRESGVALETGRRVAALEPGKAVLDDGRLLSAGTLLLCTGSTPDTALARAAGLTVRRGVVVDELLRTSDRHVYAVGDCAEPADGSGCSGTLNEAWDQADALARVLTGDAAPYRPAPQVVRPRMPGLDLMAAGDPGALHAPGDGAHGELDEQIVLSDPARGRYGRLVLRAGRVHAAALFGLPRAGATVGQLYSAGRPLPGDRLGLLLGSGGEYAAGGELPDSAVVCQCNSVTKETLVDAWRRGARDVPALAAATRATTGCGTCASLVRQVCAGAGGREAEPT